MYKPMQQFKVGQEVELKGSVYENQEKVYLWLQSENGWECSLEEADEIDFREVLSIDFHMTSDGWIELVKIEQTWWDDVEDDDSPAYNYVIEAKYLQIYDPNPRESAMPQRFAKYNSFEEILRSKMPDGFAITNIVPIDHALIRTGTLTVYDMTTTTEYEFHPTGANHYTFENDEHPARLTARSIQTEEVWAVTIAEDIVAELFWNLLAASARSLKPLTPNLNDGQ